MAVTFDPHPMTVIRPDKAPAAADVGRGPRPRCWRRPAPTRCSCCSFTPDARATSRAEDFAETVVLRRAARRGRRRRGELPVRPPRTRRHRRSCAPSAAERGAEVVGLPLDGAGGAHLVVDVHPSVPRLGRRRAAARGTRPAVLAARTRGPRRPARARARLSDRQRPGEQQPDRRAGRRRLRGLAAPPRPARGARGGRRRSRSAPTRRSTASTDASSRTCSTAPISSCTTTWSRWSSSSTCAAWCKFDSVDALITQMAADVDQARALLVNPPE